MTQDLRGSGGLETIAQFNDPVDAQLLQGRLQAEGIPAFLADEHLIQANRLLSIALGGVRVQVAGDDLARALAVLAALAAGDYALDEDSDPEALL
ncbi:MAG: hypothetical protein NVS9B10_18850 [Nevskia sp.]